MKPVVELALELKGSVGPVHRDLGDSLAFNLVPYEPQHLQTVAKAFANAVDCFHWFSYSESFECLGYTESFEIRVFASPCANPMAAAKHHLQILDDDDAGERKIRLHFVSEWRDTFCGGLLRWLEQPDQPKNFKDDARSFETFDRYVSAVADGIEAISPIRTAWIVDDSTYSHLNCLLLEQEHCHAIVDLSGFPKGIFRNPASNA